MLVDAHCGAPGKGKVFVPGAHTVALGRGAVNGRGWCRRPILWRVGRPSAAHPPGRALRCLRYLDGLDRLGGLGGLVEGDVFGHPRRHDEE